jgi:hypothetical protein
MTFILDEFKRKYHSVNIYAWAEQISTSKPHLKPGIRLAKRKTATLTVKIIRLQHWLKTKAGCSLSVQNVTIYACPKIEH